MGDDDGAGRNEVCMSGGGGERFSMSGNSIFRGEVVVR